MAQARGSHAVQPSYYSQGRGQGSSALHIPQMRTNGGMLRGEIVNVGSQRSERKKIVCSQDCLHLGSSQLIRGLRAPFDSSEPTPFSHPTTLKDVVRAIQALHIPQKRMTGGRLRDGGCRQPAIRMQEDRLLTRLRSSCLQPIGKRPPGPLLIPQSLRLLRLLILKAPPSLPQIFLNLL